MLIPSCTFDTVAVSGTSSFILRAAECASLCSIRGADGPT